MVASWRFILMSTEETTNTLVTFLKVKASWEISYAKATAKDVKGNVNVDCFVYITKTK